MAKTSLNSYFAYGYLRGVIQGILKVWTISPELRELLEETLKKAEEFYNEK